MYIITSRQVSDQVSRVKEVILSQKDDGDFLLVAAIDFGTTFSGYAFSFKATNDNPYLEEQIRINKSWGAGLGFQSYKTATSVLTTSEGGFVAFGYDAEQRYGAARGDGAPNQDADLLLFRHFKMMLHGNQNVPGKAIVHSVDGTMRPAIDIFAHALRYLKDHLLDAIGQEIGSAPHIGRIRWVITVPAIWTDASKQFMREAAFRAECIDDKHSKNLVIALEPEAASLSCRRLNLAQYTNSTGVAFPKGTKYMVLDCGGGTTDITVHEMRSADKVKEVCQASGGPWGGTGVDAHFHQLLIGVLGDGFITTFKRRHPQEWLKFMTEFERTKKSFKADGKTRLALTIPFSMGSTFEHLHRGKRIDAHLRAQAQHGVTFANGMMVLTNDAAKLLFSPVIENIVNHVKQLLREKNTRALKYILMVGGFSECQVLQQEIKRNCETRQLKILVPVEAQMAIIKGAVLFGHRPEEIGARVARYTYGYDHNTLFDPLIHDRRRQIEQDGTVNCTHVFTPYVTQGAEIEIGTKIRRTLRPIYAEQRKMTIELFAKDGMPSKPVQYTDVPDMVRVGEIKVNMDGAGLDREVEFTFTFGGTEILVDALDKASGNMSNTVLNFLYK